MGTYIGILFFVIHVICGMKSKQQGFFLFMFFSFICPVMKVGSLELSYDILGTVVLFFLILFHDKMKFSLKLSWELYLYFAVLVLSTILARTFQNGNMNWGSLLGIGRLIILYSILIKYCKAEIVVRAIYASTFVNAVVMMAQYISPSAANWSYELFAKESSQSLAYSVEIGMLNRLTGTFSNTFPVAFFMLTVITMGICYYGMTKRKMNLAVSLLAFCCGIMSVSKTFLIGFPMIIVLFFVLSKVLKRKEFSFFKVRNIITIILIGVAVAIFWSIKDRLRMGDTFEYYINVIFSGDIFDSRYGDTGVTDAAFQVFQNNWLFGVGSTTVNNEFLGDSQYIGILHDTGVIGMFFILCLLLQLAIKAIKMQDLVCSILICVIIILSFAGTTIFSTQGIIFLTFISVSLKNRKVIKEDQRYLISSSLQEMG